MSGVTSTQTQWVTTLTSRRGSTVARRVSDGGWILPSCVLPTRISDGCTKLTTTLTQVSERLIEKVKQCEIRLEICACVCPVPSQTQSTDLSLRRWCQRPRSRDTRRRWSALRNMRRKKNALQLSRCITTTFANLQKHSSKMSVMAEWSRSTRPLQGSSRPAETLRSGSLSGFDLCSRLLSLTSYCRDCYSADSVVRRCRARCRSQSQTDDPRGCLVRLLIPTRRVESSSTADAK